MAMMAVETIVSSVDECSLQTGTRRQWRVRDASDTARVGSTEKSMENERTDAEAIPTTKVFAGLLIPRRRRNNREKPNFSQLQIHTQPNWSAASRLPQCHRQMCDCNDESSQIHAHIELQTRTYTTLDDGFVIRFYQKRPKCVVNVRVCRTFRPITIYSLRFLR